jgi:hypothetical protein
MGQPPLIEDSYAVFFPLNRFEFHQGFPTFEVRGALRLRLDAILPLPQTFNLISL